MNNGLAHQNSFILFCDYIYSNLYFIDSYFEAHIFVDLGLDPGDRQVLEQRFNGFDPPCLLDSSDGR